MSTGLESSASISRVEEVVRRGWRRRLFVLVVDRLSLTLSILLAGFILLLLLGTQILAWQWLLLLALIGLSISGYGVYHRLSGSYQVAQMMDQRLALNDSLSTAWFLHNNGTADQPGAKYLLVHAEEIAATANPGQAFPFQRHGAWLVTAALLIAASILFSARYLVTRQLSLQQSFLPLAVTQVFENLTLPGPSRDQKSAEASARLKKSVPPGTVGTDAQRHAPTPPEATKQPNQDQAKSGDASQKSEDASKGDPQQAKNADGKASSDQQREGDGESKPNAPNAESNDSPDKGEQQQDTKQAEGTGPQKSSSLMDRMRDAMSSVMAKMKPNNSSQAQNDSAQTNGDGQKGDDKASSKDQSGDGKKDTGKDQSAQEQSAGEQAEQGPAKSQAAQGKSSATPSDKKGANAQSGVGHSDGDKQVREAEQAKAMGKLAEIIGKRSASLTGDMQVVPSGKQQLQTDYTHAQGQHSDLGGEINRDEISVEDQAYVREYMEMVRKKPVKRSPAAKEK